MHTVTFKEKSYPVDASGLLVDCGDWDENFAEGMAPKLNIVHGLNEKHWEIIRYIRDVFQRTGRCPLVYELCRGVRFNPAEFKNLFPTGYLRGACLLAGVSFRDRGTNLTGNTGEASDIPPEQKLRLKEKTYLVDQNGFLTEPGQWDEQFAMGKAQEMKMEGGLTDKHWRLIYFLRKAFYAKNRIPTFFECCEETSLAFEDLEALFPDGYHRGAVKIAGLRV